MSKRSFLRTSKTDFKRLDAMQDKDIDFSDIPELTPEMFAKGVVLRGVLARRKKEQVTLRLDADVLEWFRARGDGYQTLINILLRAYMDEQQRKPAKPRPRKSRRKAIA
jgi:uncharacterized protein (DUF4415 family)